MRNNTSAPPPALPPVKSGQRSNLGGSAEQGAGSRRLRWWVGVVAGLALLASLFAVTRPDADSIEAKVNEILEPTRREERNEKWLYQQAARLYAMPEPLPKLGRWIRDDDPDREDPYPDEILELGDEAGPYVLKLLEHDRSPAVRAALCPIVIEFSRVDPLPVLTNLLAIDLYSGVRAAAASAVVAFAPDRTAPALLSALEKETEYDARYAIVMALPGLGEARALDPLRRLMQSAPGSGEQFEAAMSTIAAQALGELGGVEAVKALRIALESENDDLATAAAISLAKLKDREALPRLIDRLESQTSRIAAARKNAGAGGYVPSSYLDTEFISALGDFEDRTAVPALLQALEVSNEDWERRSVIEALGEIGDERALQPLVDGLTLARDKWARAQTITATFTAIASIKSPNTLPALIGILTNFTENAADVVSAISRLPGETATAQLREIFQHSTGRVREAVAHALGMSGHPEALPVLLEAIDRGDDEARKAAAQALGMIADPQAVPALLIALKDSSSEVRQEAAWALGYIADPAGTAGLIAALKDADFSVRFAAAFALAGIQNPIAVEPLKGLLTDKERRVQIAAACSLTFHSSDAGFETLKTSLRSRSEDWHRFAAIVGLLRLNTAVAREVLEQATAEPKFPYLRQLRETGLADGASPALLTLLREGTDDQRHYAARVLPYFRDATTVAPLREAAQDTSAEVRSAARVAAVQIERQLAARQTSAP